MSIYLVETTARYLEYTKYGSKSTYKINTFEGSYTRYFFMQIGQVIPQIISLTKREVISINHITSMEEHIFTLLSALNADLAHSFCFVT